MISVMNLVLVLPNSAVFIGALQSLLNKTKQSHRIEVQYVYFFSYVNR